MKLGLVCFLLLLLTLFEDLELDNPLSLNKANLVLHGLELSLKPEVLQWNVLFSEINTNPASIAVQRPFKLPVDIFLTYLAMIPLKIIAINGQRYPVIFLPL
jgi:hypothetical protein